MPNPFDPNDPLNMVPPDQLAQMFQPFDGKRALLQRQLAQAEALRRPSEYRHTTGIGGGLGAIADVLNGYAGGKQAAQLQPQFAALDQQQAQTGARKFGLMQAIAEHKAQTEQAFEREKAAKAEALKRDMATAAAKERAAAAIAAEKTWRQHNAITSKQADGRAATIAGQKVEQKTREGMVPGLEFDEGAMPTADDAKKMKASMASANRLNSYVDQVKKLHAEHGTELTGPAAARMGQLMTAIRLEAKNVAELGALSGPDMDLMNTLTGTDPSSFGANVKAMFGSDNTAIALDGLKRWTNDTIAGNKKAFGYRDPKKPAATSADGLQLDEEFTPEEEAAYQQYKAERGIE